jgi:hypothetical protein
VARARELALHQRLEKLAEHSVAIKTPPGTTGSSAGCFCVFAGQPISPSMSLRMIARTPRDATCPWAQAGSRGSPAWLDLPRQ